MIGEHKACILFLLQWKSHVKNGVFEASSDACGKIQDPASDRRRVAYGGKFSAGFFLDLRAVGK
jgi:hypothetical protein